jgi:hypothetical protein
VALLAEAIVEEWLNRQGYFTIRGIKLGVQEIDLLAVKWGPGGAAECRHLEVQASMRPVSYISKTPKELQLSGRAANSAKRSLEELKKGVDEWVEKKFHRADKVRTMHSLYPGPWSTELVINQVTSENEVSLLEAHKVKILRLAEIVNALATQRFLIHAAAGADIIDLIEMGKALPTSGALSSKGLERLEQAIAKAEADASREGEEP